MDASVKTVKKLLDQIQLTLRQHILAIKFIRKYELWKGFWEYGWVARALIIVTVIIGLKLLSIYLGWLGDVLNISVFSSMSLMSGMLWDTFSGELLGGGVKYIFMILLEIVIFHVSRKAVSVLTEVHEAPTFKNFLNAQIRMIKVSFRSFIVETIIVALLGAFFSLFGFLSFLESLLIFGVSSYYLGFGLIDNYLEQFGFSISESVKYARNFIGVGIAGGIVLQLFFLIPGIGPLLGPFLCSVAIVLAMYKLSDIHITYKQKVRPVEEH